MPEQKEESVSSAGQFFLFQNWPRVSIGEASADLPLGTAEGGACACCKKKKKKEEHIRN